MSSDYRAAWLRAEQEIRDLEARVSVLHMAKDRLLNDLGAAERALTVKENQADACLADAEAAEARCARLQQALRAIVELGDDTHHEWEAIAMDALGEGDPS